MLKYVILTTMHQWIGLIGTSTERLKHSGDQLLRNVVSGSNVNSYRWKPSSAKVRVLIKYVNILARL